MSSNAEQPERIGAQTTSEMAVITGWWCSAPHIRAERIRKNTRISSTLYRDKTNIKFTTKNTHLQTCFPFVLAFLSSLLLSFGARLGGGGGGGDDDRAPSCKRCCAAATQLVHLCWAVCALSRSICLLEVLRVLRSSAEGTRLVLCCDFNFHVKHHSLIFCLL